MVVQGSSKPTGKLLTPTKAGLALARHLFCLTLSPKAVTHWSQDLHLSMKGMSKEPEDLFEINHFLVTLFHTWSLEDYEFAGWSI